MRTVEWAQVKAALDALGLENLDEVQTVSIDAYSVMVDRTLANGDRVTSDYRVMRPDTVLIPHADTPERPA